MKIITKLDNSSAYSGVVKRNNEMYLRAMPKVDENGVAIDRSKRYYVIRPMGYSDDAGIRTYPFIVRYEHEQYKYDETGKIKGVERICCPTSLFAKKLIQETVDENYCPVCKFSKDRNRDAFRVKGQCDKVALNLSKSTKKVWAAYIPVYVVNDPSYEGNNKHAKVLRLAGDEGKRTFDMLINLINELQSDKDAKGNPKVSFNVFNGDEGANIAILCEKVSKTLTDKKTGEPIISRETGKPITYMVSSVTDMRPLVKTLRSYPEINEDLFRTLQFDETYGTPATRDQLAAYLNTNYVNIGDDDEFGDDNIDDEFEDVSTEEPEIVEKKTPRNDIIEDVETFDVDDSEETAESAIQSIIGNGSAHKIEMPKDVEAMREEASDVSDFSDLPF